MYSFIHSYIYVFCLHRYLFKFNFEQFLPGGGAQFTTGAHVSGALCETETQ